MAVETPTPESNTSCATSCCADITGANGICWLPSKCNVNNLLFLVKDIFGKAIKDLGHEFDAKDLLPVVSAANPKFGDYQCNNAMSLFKKYKSKFPEAKSPKDIAMKIASNVEENSESQSLFELPLIVAPQGFITAKIKNSYIECVVKKIALENVKYEAEKSVRVAVDFSSPNIAKEMHVGHLRSTIVGESICRILEYLQFKVSRINHLGDWGTQFGMLIEYMKEAYPDFKLNPPVLSELNEFYKQSKQRFDIDPEFKLRARKTVVELQSGDAFARESWKLLCDISANYFNKIYERLDVHIEPRGESFYNPMIPEICEQLSKAGLIRESDGAQCIFTGFGGENEVPLMVKKSDGGFGYDTTDLCAVRHRLLDLPHEWLIYITDVGQGPHFDQVFRAAKMMGWHQPPKTRIDHMGLGLVCGAAGKKFKTRDGETVKLTDLLDEAESRAKVELERRQTEGEGDKIPTSEEPVQEPVQAESKVKMDELIGEDLSIDEASKRIGMAAVKYFDLNHCRTSNYEFRYDLMLDPKGNTAVYLLYAYARICSIFRRAGIDIQNLDVNEFVVKEAEERSLCLQLLKFPDVVNSILEDLFIHRLAEFMYQTCCCFTDFYQKCKIIGHESQNSRLVLCEATRKILYTAFTLLVIDPLPRI